MGLLRKSVEPDPANGPVLAPPPPRMQNVQPLPDVRQDLRPPPQMHPMHHESHATPSSSPIALLDHGAKIKGNLQFDCNVKIDGQIEGEIVGKQGIHIGENARVVATIRATSVVVEGQVNGDVYASERIELCPSAKVLGNLTAPALIILEGAQYEGRCSMNLQAENKPPVESGFRPPQFPPPPSSNDGEGMPPLDEAS